MPIDADPSEKPSSRTHHSGYNKSSQVRLCTRDFIQICTLICTNFTSQNCKVYPVLALAVLYVFLKRFIFLLIEIEPFPISLERVIHHGECRNLHCVRVHSEPFLRKVIFATYYRPDVHTYPYRPSKFCCRKRDTVVAYFIATPPYRGWQRSDGLFLLHSFLSLNIFVAFSILRFGTSAKSVSW